MDSLEPFLLDESVSAEGLAGFFFTTTPFREFFMLFDFFTAGGAGLALPSGLGGEVDVGGLSGNEFREATALRKNNQ